MGHSDRSSLRKFSAPEFVFGWGASSLVGAYIAKFGAARVLLVTDPGVMAAGHAVAAADRIREEGVECHVFEGVSSNPRQDEVRAGSREYLRLGCDAIVAVGGGSPMDCAKAIGLMSSNERDVLDFEGVDEVALPGPPLVCVPTTAGTAADVSQFAIINATQRKTKIAIVSKKAIPDAALIDPAVTVTMDAGLTAATGMDALTHAMEAYVSKASSPITDLDALEAIRLVARFLQRAVADGTDREAREGMMLASLLAGLAFSNAGLGIVHAMAHALGGELDLPHGLCNALLLEASVRFNFSAAVDRYRKTAIALADGIAGRFSDLSPTAAIRIDSNESVRSELSSLLLRLRAEVGLSGGLGAYGLTGDAIHAIAHKAYWDSCLATNPREVEPADLEAIYAETL